MALPFHILLVEDIDIVRNVTARMLRSNGCIVDTASTGAEAISAIQNKSYHLVFMDLGLPDIDGLTVTETLRSEDQSDRIKNLPIVALTAHSETGIREHARQAGITDFHVKPLSKEALSRYLKQYAEPYKEEELTE